MVNIIELRKTFKWFKWFKLFKITAFILKSIIPIWWIKNINNWLYHFNFKIYLNIFYIYFFIKIKKRYIEYSFFYYLYYFINFFKIFILFNQFLLDSKIAINRIIETRILRSIIFLFNFKLSLKYLNISYVYSHFRWLIIFNFNLINSYFKIISVSIITSPVFIILNLSIILSLFIYYYFQFLNQKIFKYFLFNWLWLFPFNFYLF